MPDRNRVHTQAPVSRSVYPNPLRWVCSDRISKLTMVWHESIERLLQKYCDEAQVRESLHRKAYYFYKRSLSWFQLPIIILSAASGSVQFLSKSFPKHESTIVTGTATLSIIVSIVSAIMTYLKLGENKSKNETSAGAWQGFYNTVSHQLNLARNLREDPQKFLADIKQQYDRLFEISPICNRGFILAVKKSVKKNAPDEFQIPCYLNGFQRTNVWREPNDVFEENTVSLGDEVQADVPVV